MVGTVKRYDAKKGYGFITVDNNSFFFLRTDIMKLHQHCSCREIVSFDLVRDNIGVRAINIRQVS